MTNTSEEEETHMSIHGKRPLFHALIASSTFGRGSSLCSYQSASDDGREREREGDRESLFANAPFSAFHFLFFLFLPTVGQKA